MIAVTELDPGQTAPAVLDHLGLPPVVDGADARVWMVQVGVGTGAPADGFVVRWSSPRKHWLWLHVAPPMRRQGLGSALLAVAQRQAAKDRAWRLVEAVDAPELDWFARHGFVPWGQVGEYAFDLSASAQALERLWQRLKHRIPPQADMVSLAQAQETGWGPEIARLQAQTVGGFAPMLQQRMAHSAKTGSDAGLSLDHSLVVLLEGVLVGFALARFDARQHCWMIDGFYVAPAFRDGWATLWLRYELVQTGLRLGRTPQYRVRARNDQTNTVAFARRMGASAQEPRYLLEAPLPLS